MIRYIDLVVDLLAIDGGDHYRECVQYMIDHPYDRLFICHPKAFVFEGFQQLLQGKISEEEFVGIGDSFLPVSSQNALISSDVYVESLIYGSIQNPSMYTHSLVILGVDSSLSVSSLKTSLKNIKSQIFLLPF